MKKGAGLILILGVILPLSAQREPPPMLTFLSYTATLSIFTDTTLSYDAIWNHRCYESNLLWRPLMAHPPLVIVLDGLIGAGVTVLADRLWRKDKRLAWALVIGVNIVQAYWLYWHWRLRRDEGWGR